MKPISDNCPKIPADLASHLDNEFANIQEHYLLSEYSDLLVDSGRLCEALLRYLEWRVSTTYTPIDGRSKPNRKQVVNAARQCTTLEPSLRQQAADIIEIVLDFRNNRNAAHLGSVNPNVIDATTAYQMISWVVAEILRIEATLSAQQIQEMINRFAERPVPIIYNVAGRPVVLDVDISFEDEVLVLLYDNNGPIDETTLFKWTHHSNITRWRSGILSKLAKQRLIMLDKKTVHLLPSGMSRAEQVIEDASIRD